MRVWVPPIQDGEQPETRAIRQEDGSWKPGLPGDAKSWHTGCMVTQRRATTVAAELFPDEMAPGTDCREEIGHEGKPCRICTANNERWSNRVRDVRRTLIRAFA